jgi:hypothetical protein
MRVIDIDLLTPYMSNLRSTHTLHTAEMSWDRILNLSYSMGDRIKVQHGFYHPRPDNWCQNART